MKVIDLLNKIANGEETPDRFIYDGMLFERHLDNYYQYYDRGNTMSNIVQFSDEICSDYSNLNDEIEIPEDTPKEDKKIEKLDEHEALDKIFTYEKGSNLYFLSLYVQNNIVNKLNEIIDKINGE